MSDSDRFIQLSTRPPALDAPPSCPKCGSKDTSSAASRPTANSYWRCMRCGDVWNPAQLRATGSQRWPR